MTLPWDAWGDLAWRQVWQVTALIVAVGLATRLLCRRRPHLAYLLWLLVLVKCLTPPVWSSPLGLFSWVSTPFVTLLVEEPMTPTAPALDDAPGRSGSRQTSDAKDGTLASSATLPAPGRSGSRQTSDAKDGTLASSATSMETPAIEVRLEPMLLAGWLAGVGILALGVGLRGWIGWWRLRRSSSLADAELAGIVAGLAERLGVRGSVRLLITTQPVGPAVAGWLRPVILLPEYLTHGQGRGRLEPILAHELIHIRRGDGTAALVQMVVQLLWWFHPLVWWANRSANRERERCCDEEVLAGLGCPPADYAQSLLDVLKCKRHGHLFPFPGVRAREITQRRLEHIMDTRTVFHRRTPRLYWLALAAGLAVLLPGAGLTLRGGGEGEPQPKGVVKPKVEPAKAPQAEWLEKAKARARDGNPEEEKHRLLKYDGLSFEEWAMVGRNDLKPERRAEAMYALGAFGIHGRQKEAIPIILEILNKYSIEHADQREEALFAVGYQALQKFGSSAVPFVVEQMKSPKKDERFRAMHILASISLIDKEVNQSIAKAIEDPDARVRDWALRYAFERKIVDPDQKQAAILKAIRDPSPVVSMTGQMYAAGQNPIKEHKKHLAALKEAALKHKEMDVGRKAVGSLAVLIQLDEEATPALVELYDKFDQEGRRKIMEGLANYRPQTKDIAAFVRRIYPSLDQASDRNYALSIIYNSVGDDNLKLQVLLEQLELSGQDATSQETAKNMVRDLRRRIAKKPGG